MVESLHTQSAHKHLNVLHYSAPVCLIITYVHTHTHTHSLTHSLSLSSYHLTGASREEAEKRENRES